MKIKTALLLALFIITQYVFPQHVVERSMVVENDKVDLIAPLLNCSPDFIGVNSASPSNLSTSGDYNQKDPEHRDGKNYYVNDPVKRGPLQYNKRDAELLKEKHIYGIDGTHILEERDAEVAKFLRENPDYFEKIRLSKTSAWNFNVGDSRTWFAVNFISNDNYDVVSTCRAVGTHCYIFVEDSQWENRVTQTQVNAIREAFDNRTPTNPSKGIYKTNVETFGEPPDVDSDPKIIILLLDIKDGYGGNGSYIMGYFFSQNEIADNRAEIFFIDTNPLDMKTSNGLTQGLSTLAHEFQHMIHWNYHRTTPNLTFINEGCSLVAEVVNGYSIYSQSLYANETNHYLYDWRGTLSGTVLNDYSRAAKLTLYLYEQFGVEILKRIVQSTALGQNTYSDALSKMGATIKFDQVLQNWFIANVVNDKSIKNEWGYSYTPFVKSNGINNHNPNLNRIANLEMCAVEYVSFLNGKGLEVNFPTCSPSLIIKALKEGPDKKEIIDIIPGVTFLEPWFGSIYTNITFIIMNPTNAMGQSYSINARGSGKGMELSSFYGNEPTGYYKLPQGDTICVVFDRVSGGRLDSIKVAVRREGSIVGAVYNYTGSQRPTPLGKRASEYFYLTSTSTPEHPYPVPWQNWVKQDFTSEQISTDSPFAIAFGIPQDTANYAYIMSSPISNGAFANSYNYLTTEQPPNWFRLGNYVGENIVYYTFHIIAYIGFDNSTQVLSLTPHFKLEQNYPNPFNPSTNIQFTLEKTGMTKLTIYDILGRELTTLLNEIKDAGTYEVTFNATNYASGIYYYKLQNDNMVQTKKMMLLK